MDLLSAQTGPLLGKQVNGTLSPPLTPSHSDVGTHRRTLSNSSSQGRPSLNGTTPDGGDHPSHLGDYDPFDQPAVVAAIPAHDAKQEDALPIPPSLPSFDTAKPQTRGRNQFRTYVHGSSAAGAEKAFPRISKPVELLRGTYDVVVIGSGYGGGVAASRMARAGRSVCLLERGREKWPGEYPVSAAEALGELHVSGQFAPGWLPGKTVDEGDPTGMYHLVFGKGQNAVVCNGQFFSRRRPLSGLESSCTVFSVTNIFLSGLGGTSLMNANVFMEADKDTLAMKAWPPEIRSQVDEMDRCEYLIPWA
jgi:hypothetical protein